MSDPTPWRAIGVMIVAMCFIPAGDATAKVMVALYGVDAGFIAWSRFVIGVLLVAPFLRPANFVPAGMGDWRLALRGLLLAGTVGSILQAVVTEDLATVFGAFFVGPILSYFLSAVLLGERIGAAQTVLLIAGFGGVLLCVRPGFGMTPGMLYAVAAGVFYGVFLMTGRWLAGAAPPMTILFTQLLVASFALLPLGAGEIPPMGGWMPLLLLLSGGFSMVANLLVLAAYREVAATRLAPFVYFQLVAATVYGLVLFGEVPDALTMAGLALLLVSGFGSLALPRRA